MARLGRALGFWKGAGHGRGQEAKQGRAGRGQTRKSLRRNPLIGFSVRFVISCVVVAGGLGAG
jgi:hypothetical protein